MMQSLAQNLGNSDRIITLNTKVSGRVRFYVPELYRTEKLAKRVRAELIQEDGINYVSANPLTASILVVYKPKGKKLKEIYEILEQLLDSSLESHVAGKFSLNPNLQWHCKDASEVAHFFQTSLESGLDPKLIPTHKKKYGTNASAKAVPRSKLSIFAHQYKNLPSRLLMGSTILSILTGGIADASVIAVVLVINGYIGYSMETSSEKIISSLSKPDHRKITVIRKGRPLEIPPAEVVTGDLISLEPGMIVPADGRLISAEGLTIDESILTGESLPVTKTTASLPNPNLPLADRTNMVFRGTVVTGGGAKAVVVGVGSNSEIGKIQQLMESSIQPKTQLASQLGNLGNQMSITALVSSGIMLILGILRGYGFINMLKSALSMTVAAIPESLPTVATTTLARGLTTLKKQNIIVRHLGAVETLAAVDHICLDKTGTVTMNEMEVTSVSTISGTYKIDHSGFTQKGKRISINDSPPLNKLVQIATLCNEAELLGPTKIIHPNGSSTETALLQMALRVHEDPTKIKRKYPLIATQYRTEKRPYMVTTHLNNKGKKFYAVKGSPAEVLQLCSSYKKNNKKYPLTEPLKKRILKENDNKAAQGFRILGLAYGSEKKHLTWLGLAFMTDPIRKGVKDLIPLFHQAGIESSMITGDQPLTAKAIGNEIGINNIYARVSPARKLEIVREIQNSNGKVVAMVGDGINDGPALKSADVGIAMAARGSETASQAADIVLPSDNIHGLIFAIEQGRTLHQDIKRAADYAVSKNLSEILFTLASMLIWGGEPLSPTQFLWINLITDTFPELALAQEPPTYDALIHKPKYYKRNIVSKEDINRVIFDSTALSLAPFMSYSIEMMRHGSARRASSVAFLTMAGSSLLFTFNSRSNDLNILDYKKLPKNKYVNYAISLGLLSQTAGIMLPILRKLLGLQNLTRYDIASSAFNSILPLIAIEFGKSARKRTTL